MKTLAPVIAVMVSSFAWTDIQAQAENTSVPPLINPVTIITADC